MHLKDYLKIIMERRYVVILFFVTTLAVVMFNTMTATPLYKATTRLIVEKNELNKIVASSAARFFYDENDENFLIIQEQIITSYDVAEKVLNKLKNAIGGMRESNAPKSEASIEKELEKEVIIEDENSAGNSGDQQKELQGTIILQSDEKEDEMKIIEIVPELTPQDISSTIQVTTETESNAVLISYISRAPLLAAIAANFVADAYIEQNLEIGSNTAKVSQVWMNKKIESALERLEESERKLQKYMKESDILTMGNRIAIVPEKMSQLSSRLTIAQAERKEVEAVYDSIISLPEDLTDADTLPSIARDNSLQDIQEQIVKAEQEIMRLSNKYGERHPVMIRAANNLEILQKKKKQLIEKLIKYEKNNYQLSKSKEENLRKLFLATKADAVELNDKLVKYDILKKDVESNRELYESLISKVKEQHLLEDLPPVTIRVIEKAMVPTTHFSPKKKRNIMLGLIIGLFGGIGIAFFVDYLDQTVRSAYNATKRFNIPVLGTIPFYHEKERKIENIVLNDPLSSIAEAYKSIRMFIFFSARKKLANTILVTSGAHGDGKTATAINLAVAIAQSNASVLLIDADLRDPRIHEALDLDNSKGLSTILAGVPNSVGGSIKRGPIPKMSVITSGPLPENPSEMIGSKRMSLLLRKIEKRFDYIIFDSPVINMTESLIIARYVDGTIVITRAGKTTYHILEEELHALKNVNASVFGLVINGAAA